MKHNLEYYLSLPYRIEVDPIPEDDGGGYCARLSQFGDAGIIGDGDTIEESIAQLHEAKELRFRRYLEEGREIPEPEALKNDFSGKFVTRVPQYIHRQLTLAAKMNGVSLNQYINSLLATGMTSDVIGNQVSQIKDEIHGIYESICNMNYSLKAEVKNEVDKRLDEYCPNEYERLAA